MKHLPLAALAVLALAATACGSGFEDKPAAAPQSSGPASLRILIASSGDAETKAVKEAAAAWAKASGNTATVTPAQDIAQQLAQAFAGGTPPDVFYVDASQFADYASVGALEPYGDQMLEQGRLLPEPASSVHLGRQALLRRRRTSPRSRWRSTPTCGRRPG